MKLTTKLLLGATVVAGLSISAFAACATDVDFGGTKKITGLADGSADGDAVNYGQFAGITTATVTETNSSNWSIETNDVTTKGLQTCINLVARNVSGNAYNGNIVITLGVLPVGHRPLKDNYNIAYVNGSYKNTFSSIGTNGAIRITNSGDGVDFAPSAQIIVRSCFPNAN